MAEAVRPDSLAQELQRILVRSRPLWEGLRGQSLFVTGGTGLFGRWILESAAHANRALDLGLKILVLSRHPERFAAAAPHLAADPAIRFHRGNIAEFDFPAGTYPYVIHGAATSAAETFRGEDPLAKFDTLVAGTRRTLEFARRCEARRFLFLSSGVVYGAPPPSLAAIPEDYPGAPDTCDVNSALGQAKRAAEYLCAYYGQRHGFESVVARCFSFVGPFLPLDLHYAVGNFIDQALRADAIVVRGDGTPLRSYLYLGDLVSWLLTLLIRAAPGRAYNVGSDEAISIGDLARRVGQALAPGKPVRILGEAPYSVGNQARNLYVPDITRARRELGLAVWTPLDAAIRLTGGRE
jgi:nucleoside-diphosphate-sugar epimerase